jgi:N-acyl-D-aspartate/D-glutamate deacylase
VRERHVLSLEEAVRRMTSVAAATFGLEARGQVREGYWADLVLFDPQTVLDTATYDDPKQMPQGIRLVVVNGRVAMENGQHADAGSGKMLRYRRSAHGEGQAP